MWGLQARNVLSAFLHHTGTESDKTGWHVSSGGYQNFVAVSQLCTTMLVSLCSCSKREVLSNTEMLMGEGKSEAKWG